MPTNFDLVVHLFLQMSVILATCRVAGFLLRYLGQTQVVSEMIAGVLLGPSLFGLIAPRVQQALFPAILTLAAGTGTGTGTGTITVTHPSMAILFALSQLGLVLYMFLIGVQLNVDLIGQHFREAGRISLSGILAPMLLGGVWGLVLVTDHRLFTDKVVPWQAALFTGVAMSITAFPMLARIIYEKGLMGTRIGTLAISAAAFDDAAAWSLLALVLATTKNSPLIAWLAIGGGAMYALAMIFVTRPLLQRLERRTRREATPDDDGQIGVFSFLMLVVMLCAWFTDMVGIYAVFGAFIAGAVMPRTLFREEWRRSIEYLTVSVLLPVFFVYSGLSTRIGLLVDPALFWIAVVTMVVAFVSKLGGCTLATRLGGSGWREAVVIGVLMNARGLMELILLNIGLQSGLISPALFTILVLMAIVTTFAASPLFNLFYRPPNPAKAAPG